MSEQDQNAKASSIYDIEDVPDYILAELDKTVKHDEPTKKAVLCTAVSAYIPDCQINTFLKGGSSHGKTYNVTEVVKYFPKADVWLLGGLSKKALVHSYGIRLNNQGKEIKLEDKPKKPLKKNFKKDEDYEEARVKWEVDMKEWNKEWAESYILIDLNNIIMVFLEAPDEDTLRELKPLLSHDAYEIEFKFTDKSASGSFRTSKVVVRGHPATFFCSTDKKYVEEEATRGLTVTPEASAEKYGEANKVTMDKIAYKHKYKRQQLEPSKIKQLLWEIREAFVAHNYDVMVPFPNLNELYPHIIARDMRDFKYFNWCIAAIGVLNMHRRVIAEIDACLYVLPSISDVKKVCKFFSTIFETTRTGTDSKVLDFYWTFVFPHFGDATVKHLTEAYNADPENSVNKKSTDVIRDWLKRLRQLDYVESFKSEHDKREYIYRALVTKRHKLFENGENGEISWENENQLNLEAFLKNGFESWLENISGTVRWFICIKNAEGTAKLVEISVEDAKEITCG